MILIYVKNSIEESSSCETDSHLTSGEILYLLGNPGVNYCSQGPTICHKPNCYPYLSPHFFKIHFKITYQPPFRSSKCDLAFNFESKTFYACYVHATCFTHLVDLITLIFEEKYKLWSSVKCFLNPTITSFLPLDQIFLAPCSQTQSSMLTSQNISIWDMIMRAKHGSISYKKGITTMTFHLGYPGLQQTKVHITSLSAYLQHAHFFIFF